MPCGRWWPAHPSHACLLFVVAALLVVLQWPEPYAKGVGVAASLLNKLEGGSSDPEAPFDLDLMGFALLLLCSSTIMVTKE